jgi:acetolactate synthase I/II/III large subunit
MPRVPPASGRIADMVASLAVDAGVTTAFGHPGGEVTELIGALEKAGISFVLTRHETQAAFMAGGVGEITGVPGMCVSTLGPGATNMVTGVASALLERAPLIAVTADIATGVPGGTTHQVLPLHELYRPVVKRSLSATAATVPDEIASVMACSIAPRPGPVHLSLASDVAEMQAPTGNGTPAQDAGASSGPITVARASRMIRAAGKPAILAGVGAVQAGRRPALQALARRLGAPLAVLPKAKGSAPEDEPLFLGVLEMAGQDLVVEALRDADLLIAVGLDPVEMDVRWPFTAPVIHVDWLPNAEEYYPAELELTGNPAVIVDQLLSDDLGRGDRWALQDIVRGRAELKAYVRPAASRLQPWQVIDAVREALPHDAIATCDVGAHKMLVGQAWTTYQPRTFFMANGLSSMGYALPTAAAAYLMRPSVDVVAFVGDGGLGMYLGELETLARIGARVLIVVFADSKLELIRRSQARRGLPESGTSFSNPDFTELGRAFGIPAAQVESLEDLDKALEKFATAPGVRLIAAHIDGLDYRF